MVTVDGKTFKTKPIKINISSTAKPKKKQRSGSFPFNFFPKGRGFPFFFDPFGEDSGGDTDQLQDKDLKVKLKVNKDKVYLGEMLLAGWHTYINNRFPLKVRTSADGKPVLDGFWVEVIDDPVEKRDIEELDGVPYRRQPVMDYALFALKTGKLKIGQLKTTHYLKRSAFFSSPLILNRTSDPKTVTVLPLPKEGKSSSFSGAIGDFLVTSSVNTKKGRQGDPFVYSIVFEGKGHPRFITLPKLDFGPQIEVYDTSHSETFSYRKSKKEFELLLIPKTASLKAIPEIELSTFDPDLGVYRIHLLSKVELQIAQNDNSNSTVPDSTGGGGLAEEEGDIETPGFVLSPVLSLGWEDRVFSSVNRKVFMILFFGTSTILCALFLVFPMVPERRKSFLQVFLKDFRTRFQETLQKESWQNASLILNEMLFEFLMHFCAEENLNKDLDFLIMQLPPSIRIRFEKNIRDIFSKIDELGFSPEGSGRSLLEQKKKLEALFYKAEHLIIQISASRQKTKSQG